MKILLAEDDPNVTYILLLVLEKLGQHEVVVAEDGAIAYEKAMKEGYDLILLDGMMPKMTGIEVLRAIISKLGEYCPPVIYLSAKNDLKELEEVKKLGAGHIPKPFDPQTINDKINGFLQDKLIEAS